MNEQFFNLGEETECSSDDTRTNMLSFDECVFKKCCKKYTKKGKKHCKKCPKL